MKKILVAGALALASAGAANADIKYDIVGTFSFTGPQFLKFTNPTPIAGTLTGISVTFDYSGALGGSWAADAVVGIAAPGPGVAWGGFNTTFGLPNLGPIVGLPSSGADGTYSGTGSGASYVILAGDNVSIIFGNGYLNENSGFTVNNLSITLIGVDKVPAPGAVALLGLAGFISRRRRA